MTEAIGIHDHPKVKLGLRPAVDKPALRFADHLAVVPAHPIADPAPAYNWPIDDNDKWGDCVVAGADHALEAIYRQLTGSYANWTDAQILAYYRTQNPGFDPSTGANDNGMVIQIFLEYLVKTGVLLAFAKVDPHNEEEMKAATYLGLAVVTGETLTVAQQNQTIWDYVAGSPTWGGHCTTTIAYDGSPDYEDCVTWGEVVPQTQAFVQQQVSEAWFVLTQAHVDNPSFRAGFDLAGFALAYTEITGSPFPVVVPPPAPVPPAPVPPPPKPRPPHHHRRHWWQDRD